MKRFLIMGGAGSLYVAPGVQLAVAFVDEMEKGAHIRRRFTVGS